MAVLEDQVVDHIMGSAEVEEVVANYADVISGAAVRRLLKKVIPPIRRRLQRPITRLPTRK